MAMCGRIIMAVRLEKKWKNVWWGKGRPGARFSREEDKLWMKEMIYLFGDLVKRQSGDEGTGLMVK